MPCEPLTPTPSSKQIDAPSHFTYHSYTYTCRLLNFVTSFLLKFNVFFNFKSKLLSFHAMNPLTEPLCLKATQIQLFRGTSVYATLKIFIGPFPANRRNLAISLSKGTTKLTHAFVRGYGDRTGAIVLTVRCRCRCRCRSCCGPVIVMASQPQARTPPPIRAPAPAAPAAAAAAGPTAAAAAADPNLVAVAADATGCCFCCCC